MRRKQGIWLFAMSLLMIGMANPSIAAETLADGFLTEEVITENYSHKDDDNQSIVASALNDTETIVESGECGPDATWTLDDQGTLVISGTGEITKSINDYVPADILVNTVIINEGITAIGDAAFTECASITSVSIPDSVISIGNDAFVLCMNLPTISIPGSVTSIGECAFDGCEFLESINVESSNTTYTSIDGVLYDKNVLHLIRCPERKLSVNIPQTVESIENWAFYYCSSMSDIVLPDSVTSIGKGAFEDCLDLITMDIPSHVISIGEEAFAECISLTSIHISGSVTSIGKNAFDLCPSLTEISVEPANTVYASVEGILYDKNVKDLIKCPEGKASVIIPDSVTRICSGAFSNCSSLTRITIPDKVTIIEDLAFGWCSSLGFISISDSVASIGEMAFHDISDNASVFFWGRSTSISNDNFGSTSTIYCYENSGADVWAKAQGYTNIVYFDAVIDLPANLTDISSEAFAGLGTAGFVHVPDTVTIIADDAFKNSSITIIASFGSYAVRWAQEHGIDYILE